MIHINFLSAREEFCNEVRPDQLILMLSMHLVFFKTSAEVITNISSSLSKFLAGNVGIYVRFSLVKTLTKKSFKTSAFSLPELVKVPSSFSKSHTLSLVLQFDLT